MCACLSIPLTEVASMGITMETRRNANTLGVSAAQRLAAASSARLPGIDTGTRN